MITKNTILNGPDNIYELFVNEIGAGCPFDEDKIVRQLVDISKIREPTNVEIEIYKLIFLVKSKKVATMCFKSYLSDDLFWALRSIKYDKYKVAQFLGN